MLMITTVHFEGAYITWKGQVRFLKFMDQSNTVNIKNNEIGVLSKLSYLNFVLKTKYY